ncbi:hypothetical protein CORC01_06820 [Colletotrichum orchidophilum]|uniref:Uncharacterized protein n=1 Tax=Colletotrichum orchidophilum TaxID=1209926 RepID=A0A1G4B959_9PEZI|nr:uncharacterized protein CORC01_06820 [Colletotrichum orchidophilum]OHE97957.1 hypothetical protein CORC01_06820 [Colletotrichum orchidophilum]
MLTTDIDDDDDDDNFEAALVHMFLSYLPFFLRLVYWRWPVSSPVSKRVRLSRRPIGGTKFSVSRAPPDRDRDRSQLSRVSAHRQSPEVTDREPECSGPTITLPRCGVEVAGVDVAEDSAASPDSSHD